MENNKTDRHFTKDTVFKGLYILCCAVAVITAFLTFAGNIMNNEARNNLAVIAMLYFLFAMLVQTFFPGKNAKWYIIAGSFFAAMLPTDFFLKLFVAQRGEGSGLFPIMMIILLGIWMFVNTTAKNWSAERRAGGYSFDVLLRKLKQ